MEMTNSNTTVLLCTEFFICTQLCSAIYDIVIGLFIGSGSTRPITHVSLVGVAMPVPKTQSWPSLVNQTQTPRYLYPPFFGSKVGRRTRVWLTRLIMAGAKYLNLSSYFRPTPSSLEVGAELNRGAYGAVHAGELDGRPAAIKKIHIRLMEAAKEDEKSWEKIIKDFEKECRLLETLEHPHIVGFWGAFYDVESKEPILVMEQMKENLRDFLAREVDLSRHRQVDICLSIARALEFLHSRSPPTVHRDLTDKNVMLSQEGVVKVGDLGQSHLKDSSVEYFNTGQPGAVPFMPPEALRPTPHYTEKIDMFSLGVLMLEVATGHQPSAGLVGIGTQPEVVRREKDLSKLPDDHPLRPIILECLKDDYKERPPAFLVRCFVESEVVSDSIGI